MSISRRYRVLCTRNWLSITSNAVRIEIGFAIVELYWSQFGFAHCTYTIVALKCGSLFNRFCRFVVIHLLLLDLQCGYAGAASGGQFQRCFGSYFWSTVKDSDFSFLSRQFDPTLFLNVSIDLMNRFGSSWNWVFN